MIRAAIIGYGNIGKAVLDTAKYSGDIEIIGIVSRSIKEPKINGIDVVDDILKLKDIDTAFLCTPSRNVPDIAEEILTYGINTVDSYDIHSTIYDVKSRLDAAAKKGNAVSMLSAGFDPGADSIIRTVFEAMMPKGLTYTDFGPGMSMGHTVVVREITGVKDALVVTIPDGAGIHRRMIYLSLEDNANIDEISESIRKDAYFVGDDIRISVVDNVEMFKDLGHGVKMSRKGASGSAHNQRAELTLAVNNPALTAQMLICAARAAKKQKAGCYTMIEVPPIDFLEGDDEEKIRRLV